MMMPNEIGSYDAKTKLSELLRDVQNGSRYTITLRGKPVADLVPSDAGNRRDVRESVEAIRAFPKIKGVKTADLRRWASEGRK